MTKASFFAGILLASVLGSSQASAAFVNFTAGRFLGGRLDTATGKVWYEEGNYPSCHEFGHRAHVATKSDVTTALQDGLFSAFHEANVQVSNRVILASEFKDMWRSISDDIWGGPGFERYLIVPGLEHKLVYDILSKTFVVRSYGDSVNEISFCVIPLDSQELAAAQGSGATADAMDAKSVSPTATQTEALGSAQPGTNQSIR